MRLVFTSDSREGRVVEIDGGRLTVGRVEENDLQLVDDKVSRHHAVIELRDDGRAVLRDLDSRNGTFVNGLRLSGSYVLAGGEQLRFGDEQLRVELSPGAAVGSRESGLPAPAPDARPSATTDESRAAAPATRSRGRRTYGAVAAILLALAVLVFGVGQLVLPGIAEQRLRSELARHGTVREVRIQATPAVELLWHRADSVTVVLASSRSEPSGHGSLADFLSRTRDTGRLEVSVATLQSRLLTLHSVHLRKSGDHLLGEAELTQQALSAALPSFVGLRPVSASPEGIVVQVSASVLGVHAAVHLAVRADAGRIVVRPEGLPLGSLATITVFADPRIYVESVGAELHGERYLLRARARLM